MAEQNLFWHVYRGSTTSPLDEPLYYGTRGWDRSSSFATKHTYADAMSRREQLGWTTAGGYHAEPVPAEEKADG